MHFRKHQLLTAKSGFTLIEVLLAVVIVGTVLTAIATTLTGTVKNAAESRYRTRATTLSQEGLEFFTRERQLEGWGDFQAFFPNGTTTYCVADLPNAGQLATLSVGACATGQGIDEPGVEFLRQAVVTKDPAKPGQIDVVVNVSWIDGTLTPTVLLERIYRQTDS